MHLHKQWLCGNISNMKRIYLDNASTSFPKAPGVADAIALYINSKASGIDRTVSSEDEDNFDTLFSIRTMIASLYSYNHPECVAFTRNITEALNWLIKGLFTVNNHIIVSSNEHNAVMRPLNEEGIPYSRIPSTGNGYNDYRNLESLIEKNTKGIIINAASNVSGAVQNLEIPAEIARKHNLMFIVDSAQASPYIDINMDELNATAVAFTGHKGFLGPDGTGGMLIRRDVAESIKPLIAGGTGSESDSEEIPHTLPERLSPGTMNMTGLTGLEKAMRFSIPKRKEIAEKLQGITEKLYLGLSCIDGIEIKGAPINEKRSPIISIVSRKKDIAEIAALLLERGGIETRVGLHCAPSAHKSIGTFPIGTLRLSPGPFTTDDDIEKTLVLLKEIMNE